MGKMKDADIAMREHSLAINELRRLASFYRSAFWERDRERLDNRYRALMFSILRGF